MTVLDASAVLAWLRQERGGAVVEAAIQAGARISAVHLAKVLSKFAEQGEDVHAVVRDLQIEGLEIELYGAEDAVATGVLRPLTSAQGLSLGDRACLVLGQRLGIKVLTADQSWARLPTLGIDLSLIR